MTIKIRAKLIDNIVYYNADKFKSAADVVELSAESDEQLVDRLVNTLDHYYDLHDQSKNA